MWGFDGVVLTPRLQHLDISFVVMMLHLIPFLLMQPFFYRQYRFLAQFNSNDWLFFILIAAFGGTVGTLAIVKALFLVDFQHLSIVVLLQKLQPVFAILLARIILGEHPSRRFYGYAGLAILSTYFVTFGLHLPDLSHQTVLIHAASLALLAAFSFGGSTVFSKKILQKYSFYTANFYRFGLTALMMMPMVLASGKMTEITRVTQFQWLIFLLIAVTTGGASLFLYYFGLKKVSASLSTICELCYPLSAILFDYWINGRVLSLVQWTASGVLLMCILVISLDRKTGAV
jgi:drug/metabolite transporter (DMT)-like permease